MKNCCTNPGPEPKKVSAAEAGRTLQTRIDGADALRTAQLGGLQALRRTKGAMLMREQTRLSAALGPQHPQVLALSQKIAVNQTRSEQLQRAQARAQVSSFQADPNAWIVHGHVRTADLKPVPQATVALYTCEGQWLPQFGYACTNGDGYFKLTVRPSASISSSRSGGVANNETNAFGAPPVQGTPAGAPPDQGTAAGAQLEQPGIGATPAAAATGRQACLNATDAHQRFLGGADGPLTPHLGALDYREIIVERAAGSCAPPPDGSSGAAPGCPDAGEKTRFLGNSHNREVHDLQNTKKTCGIDRISADHRVFFRAAEDAIKAGYDYCAYCFGKSKSRR
jgi:hypothetical protein